MFKFGKILFLLFAIAIPLFIFLRKEKVVHVQIDKSEEVLRKIDELEKSSDYDSFCDIFNRVCAD